MFKIRTISLLGLITIIFLSSSTAQNSTFLFSYNYEFRPEDRVMFSNSTATFLVWNNDTDFLNRTDDIVKMDINLRRTSVPISMNIEIQSGILYKIDGDTARSYRSLVVQSELIMAGSLFSIIVDWSRYFQLEKYTPCDICEDRFVISQVFISLSSDSMWNHSASVSINAKYITSSEYLNETTSVFIDTSGIIVTDEPESSGTSSILQTSAVETNENSAHINIQFSILVIMSVAHLRRRIRK